MIGKEGKVSDEAMGEERNVEREKERDIVADRYRWL